MLILTLIFLILLVIFPLEVSNSVASSLDLCLKSVIPALFPFLIVSYIITETSIPNNYFTLFLSKLFNISPQSVPAYISGILCGYPIGGKMALELFEKGKIGKNEKDRLLIFANNSGPGFIIGMVGGVLFKSIHTGMIIYISHVFSSLIYAIITSFSASKVKYSIPKENKKISFLPALSFSIRKSMESLINITGVILFFSSVISLLNLIPSVDSFSFKGLLFGLLEMTNGIKVIVSSTLSLRLKAAISSFLVTFSGFCVFMQLKSFSEKINTASYFLGKTLCAVFAFLLTYFIV
ncbi:MAG: hypothetical protein E7419_01215 [Ruminococcaceae bacterium]|nr:hypothetical protein [Oscillospiraceae bacterium]